MTGSTDTASEPGRLDARSADHRIGFETLDREVATEPLAVEGRLPDWLHGSLLRIGPAKYEAGDRRVNHWFDGLSMLHRFAIDGGEVSYANRFLRTNAYRSATETGALSYSEFATDPCRSLFKRVQSAFNPKLTDNANVNLMRLGENVVAMTETPLPVLFDPETLDAAGVAYRPPGEHTTAHPHRDPATGEALNYATKFGPRSTYRLYAKRSVGEQRVLAKLPVSRPSYMHSFGVSERYAVLTEFPLVVNPLDLVRSGRPFIENYRWEPERGTRFIVIDRSSGEVRARAESEPFFCFHHVNAFEDGDDLVVDLVAYDDASVIQALYLDALRANAPIPPPELRRYRVALDRGTVAGEGIAEGFELPRIDYRRHNARPYRYVYGNGPAPDRDPRSFITRIQKADLADRSTLEWSEPGCHPGEPVFVAGPDAREEDDGVVLSVVLDAGRGTSFLLVLDARDLGEVARAGVPHAIPFGFHGQFLAS
jgi:carotenoid cleavage dioxygenase-like enzyme